MALFKDGGLAVGWNLYTLSMIVGGVLDLSGMAALAAGLGSNNLPAPLAVGYVVTTAGSVLLLAAFGVVGTIQGAILGDPLSVGTAASIAIVLETAFFVPYWCSTLSNEEQGDGIMNVLSFRTGSDSIEDGAADVAAGEVGWWLVVFAWNGCAFAIVAIVMLLQKYRKAWKARQMTRCEQLYYQWTE